MLSDTMPKKNSDRHKVPRVPFQIPKPFADLARRLAAKKEQPTTWYVMRLIADAAKEAGIKDVPKFPWEEELG